MQDLYHSRPGIILVHITGNSEIMATSTKHSTSKTSTAKRAPRTRARKATANNAPTTRPERAPAKKPVNKWSAAVMEHSDALDLQNDVFKLKNPKAIAESLKKSADASKRKKGTPYQSAMSMLNFYINRAGKNLPAAQHKVLEKAKTALREVYGRA